MQSRWRSGPRKKNICRLSFGFRARGRKLVEGLSLVLVQGFSLLSEVQSVLVRGQNLAWGHTAWNSPVETGSGVKVGVATETAGECGEAIGHCS